MKAKTKPNGSNGQRPKSAPTHDGDNRSFCGKAMEILDWACTGSGKWEWPIDRLTGSSNAGWVSSFFYELEKAFDPAFYAHKQRKADESDYDYQKRVDVELMTRQRDLAAALWECDPELAGRYAEILRIVEKPAGLPNVDKRVAFLQEIERRENLTKGTEEPTDVQAETKCARAAILREHLVLSPGSMPKGPISDALQALKPDTFQIFNLRLQRNDNGKIKSWREVAMEFKRADKEGKSYTAERCRQIYVEAINEYPVLNQYMKGLSKCEPVKLDPEQEPTDTKEIENMTAPKGIFDKNDFSADNNPGFRITTNPRKPIYLPNSDK